MSTKDDIRHLTALLRKRCLPSSLWRVSVLAVVTILWILFCQQILKAGALVRYDTLQSLGTQVVTVMTRANPYLWWGLTIILTLIVLSLARAWFKASVLRTRGMTISVADVQKLSQDISAEAVDVLLWVWDQEAGPVTIGDLIRSREELRSGRVRKLAMARAQHDALTRAKKAQPVASDHVQDEMIEPRLTGFGGTATDSNSPSEKL